MGNIVCALISAPVPMAIYVLSPIETDHDVVVCSDDADDPDCIIDLWYDCHQEDATVSGPDDDDDGVNVSVKFAPSDSLEETDVPGPDDDVSASSNSAPSDFLWGASL